MVLYVVYRASIESKKRSSIPARLKELGCQQVHRAFWKVNEKKVHHIFKVLENNQPILLRRLREIKNPKLAKKKEFSGLGSLIVVTFTLPKGANRENVTSFLRRAPCIRLRRSVYAFSQKHSLYEKEPKLVDALKFVNFIREIQGKVKIISRAVIVNVASVERLMQETRERVEKAAADIVSSCKEIYIKARTTNDYGVIRDRFSRIKRRFLILKKVATVYEVWLKIDFSKSLMKAYHAQRRVNAIINPT
ncbi:MAG: hypothetical protein CW691_10080 [Candidatus Bathyarchaeum sp.]|nr:MAG: hypothetical protein CW691_10080 [Candidatus Bathyarchaeum sp.]